MKTAVVGGGWAGLAAAVRARQAGCEVTLFEMASHLGGRARSVALGDWVLDNGQHILIGAYSRTLDLLATVECAVDAAFERRPLELRYPDGRGFRLPKGPVWWAFTRAVLGCRGWDLRDRTSLMTAAAGWALRLFRCPPEWSVERLCRGLTPAVRELLIEPLCIAALNTPSEEASAQVMLRVLADALFGGPGSADLLLPRRPLGELLPEPAGRWLAAQGCGLQTEWRVHGLRRVDGHWQVDGHPFDRVILACSAAEAARLTQDFAPGWAELTRSLHYEPIVTVYAECPGARLPSPMTSLFAGPAAPAQFAFDHGALGRTSGVFAFVVSGAAGWLKQGLEPLGQAVLQQALDTFAPGTWPQAPQVLRVLAERRATFRCTPGLLRPPAEVAPGIFAAGDYIQGPYPATLEGAVRSGEQAVLLALT